LENWKDKNKYKNRGWVCFFSACRVNTVYIRQELFNAAPADSDVPQTHGCRWR